MKIHLILLLLFSIPSFAEDQIDCEKAYTTNEINICSIQEADEAFDILEKYLAKARQRYVSEKSVLYTLNLAQESWLKYRDAHCNAIYEQWSGGTIRGAMYGGCMLKLNKLRTHVIWEDYLTHMDSTPPLLPEPEL
jgi:uncharacterized protein YecT (DUF1311 family)